MREAFQIAGELWTAVIVAFLLLAVAHYGYGQWVAYQQRKRLKRIEASVMAAVLKWEATYGRRIPDGDYTWDKRRNSLAPADAPATGEPELFFQRPMGVKPPEKGWIAESRFTLYAENEADAIDALMGKETADG